MPLMLQTTDLQAGMRLARPIVSGTVFLLPEGKQLSEADVVALRRGYPTLHVTVVDPLLDEAVDFQNDTREEAVSNYVRRRFTRTIQQAHETLMAEASLRGMDFRAIEAAIVEIVGFLRKNPVTWALLADHDKEDNPLVQQAGNVFYLSMVLGNAVRGCVVRAKGQPQRYPSPSGRAPAPDLAPLGLAALLRDISLWSAYQKLDHPGPLTPEERDLVYQHPQLSVEMLPDGISRAAATAVRDHHENHNGSGYPRQLTGQEIPFYARVLRIAEAYSAATSPRAHRAAKSAVKAFWEMTCGPYARFYDPVVLKVFQAVVQPYPIGAKVRLSCGRFGVVVRHGRIHGLLPEIVIAFSEDGEPLSRDALEGPYSLECHPEMRIISFQGEDLSDLYGSEPIYEDHCPQDPCLFETIYESCYP